MLKNAYNIKDSLIRWRRFLHENPELTDNIPITSEYVSNQLESFGYNVSRCSKYGITCTVGDKKLGKVLLLRADMDALPMNEDNDLEFKSKKDNIAHCCGHDIHTAMLLGVAKILKDNESSLSGIVKFMFQPNEEGGGGAFDMIEHGILSNPKVDSVFAVHVDALAPLGKINYGYGATFASNDNMDIHISGKSSHGARPHEGIDPINIAFQLYNLFQSYITREKSPMDIVIFSITSINSGNSYNIVPDSSLMKATLRTYSESVRKNTLARFKEIATFLANMYNTKIDISVNSSISSLVTNKILTDKIKGFIPECLSEENVGSQVIKMGSEDFSYVTEKVPDAAYFFIGAGRNKDEGYEHGQHTSKVIFNEDCMCIGVAFMSYMAIEFFKSYK